MEVNYRLYFLQPTHLYVTIKAYRDTNTITGIEGHTLTMSAFQKTYLDFPVVRSASDAVQIIQNLKSYMH